MPKIFIKNSGNLKPKNVKSINNTTDSHLVNYCVIPGSDTMQEWEKEVFWQISALGNLQCNKNNNLKFRESLKKIPER